MKKKTKKDFRQQIYDETNGKYSNTPNFGILDLLVNGADDKTILNYCEGLCSEDEDEEEDGGYD